MKNGDDQMVAHENEFKGVAMKGLETVDQIVIALASIIPNDITNDDVVFFCIGTDRSTGDSMAPLVGTYLEGLGYKNVMGTIDDPVHAVNLDERIAMIPEGKTVIAIDACLGNMSSIETVHVINGSLKPGEGVNKQLTPVGDYSITATVNVGGFMEYFVLQNTRLATVMKLAKNITSALVQMFPLEGERQVPKQKKTKSQSVKKEKQHV